MNILLVDDDQSILNTLTIALEAEGVDAIRVATNGVIALDELNDFRPDLIFLDYIMPVMNGEATATRIREMYPDARIIAFSADLERKPEWADDFYEKGDLPDLHLLIHLDD